MASGQQDSVARFYFYALAEPRQGSGQQLILMEMTIDFEEQTVSLLLKAEDEEVSKSFLVLLSTALRPFLT